ncbi:hypothetical protein THIOKS12100030 [Thiocapsa sp. KS1]|nr:hypothetical protein THIOKS12100030 [Thiocapsa sp. KS1]
MTNGLPKTNAFLGSRLYSQVLCRVDILHGTDLLIMPRCITGLSAFDLPGCPAVVGPAQDNSRGCTRG